jgi:hypothetical protein
MKPQISNRLVIAAMIVALVPLSFAAGHQDNNQAPNQIASQGVSDRFIGIWKLRADKTSQTGSLSQVITIEDQGKNYKFTYDLSVGNGKENHLWYITEMKGKIVTDSHLNGQPIPGKSRITRIDSSSFKVEGEIQKDVFKVSLDGQTMKVQTTYSVQTRPNVLHDVSLVFDRQK